jgi:hypothetical protein
MQSLDRGGGLALLGAAIAALQDPHRQNQLDPGKSGNYLPQRSTEGQAQTGAHQSSSRCQRWVKASNY